MDSAKWYSAKKTTVSDYIAELISWVDRSKLTMAENFKHGSEKATVTTRMFAPRWMGLLAISAAAFSMDVAATNAATSTAHCSKPEVQNRPKIGLALGGGGARGYAHIGVIKRLEELRVPYDYIAGTSVGSIVGGFLATGMTAEQLADVVRKANWKDLFDDKTQREDLPFRRKADTDLGLHGPKFGLGSNSSLLPSGVVSGQKILFMFESVATRRNHVSNFDDLPIAFRAIATDIVTGDMVVINDGDLAIAMRASMAVPAIFDPVRRNDQLLVDGGLSRNLPVDVARNMGADVVIAVDVGTKLATEEDVNNVLKIVYQMTSLLTVQNTSTQIEAMLPGDVLISPAIGNTISSADFNKLDEAIPLGYDATRALDEKLKPYSLSEADYAAWREQVTSCVQEKPKVQFIHLDNQSRFSDEVILKLITIQPGENLDLKRLESDIRQIYGLGFIRQAKYAIVQKEGQQGIEIEVLEDARGSRFLETGLDLSSSLRGTEFNIRAAYLNIGLDKRGAEFRTMVQFGESPGIFVDFYKPLDDTLRYSVWPSAFAFSRPLLYFDDKGHPLAELDIKEIGGSITFGREFKRHLAVFAGYARFAGNLKIEVGLPHIKPYSFNGGEMFTQLVYDRLDDRYLPSRGAYAHIQYTVSDENFGADADYSQIEIDYFSTRTFGLHNIMWGGQYNTSDAASIPDYALFTAGGFLNMSGFDPNSLIGPQFGHIMAGYRYQVGKSGLLPGYIGTTLEYGNVATERQDLFKDGYLNGSVYMAYGSPLGPVYLGIGWSDDRSPIYFLRLGSVFGPRAIGSR